MLDANIKQRISLKIDENKIVSYVLNSEIGNSHQLQNILVVLFLNITLIHNFDWCPKFTNGHFCTSSHFHTTSRLHGCIFAPVDTFARLVTFAPHCFFTALIFSRVVIYEHINFWKDLVLHE